jgi:hypothetical protein
VVVLLFRVASRYAHPTLAWLVTVLFGVHPLCVEAYGWINGRADLLAGLMVVTLAWSSMRAGPLGPARLLVAAACAMAAVLAKETAAAPVLALAFAQLFAAQGLPSFVDLRRRSPIVVAGVLGVVLALALRVMLVGIRGSGQAALQAQSNVLESLVRLYAGGLTSALVPVPRTMATLAWELSTPLDGRAVAILLLASSMVVATAVRGYLRSTLLFLGAAATLAPAMLVGTAFWCGFDRYLYMPAILVALGISVMLGSSSARYFEHRWLRTAGVCVAMALALATFYTAKNYHSHPAFIASMMQLRPDDPSGLAEAGQREEARKLLTSVPRQGLPRPLASALITRLASVGKRDEAIAVLEDMVRRYPDDPYAIYDLVGTSMQRGDLERAFVAAERLRPLAGFCDGVQVILTDALGRMTTGRRRVEDFRRSYSCD